MQFKHISILWAFVCGTIVAGAQNQNESSKPIVLGTSRTFYSKELTENRTVNIYLPEGYNIQDTIHYPVIYLLDGGIDEDFIHVVGLVQFYTFPWIHLLPPTIVVGIANVNRQRDFTYPTTIEEEQKRYPNAGHSDRFIQFLEKDLMPYINQAYRTDSFRTLIGESLGGLLASEILIKKPALFYQYIIISPSLWWDNGSLLSMPYTKGNDRRSTKVYIAVGKEGIWPGKTPHMMEVDANLLADKLTKEGRTELRVYFDYLPEENHATISHPALMRALHRLYSNSQTEHP
ncbi:MAG: alpha/beta hydrolase [Flavisolibacter sp.]